MAFSESPNLKKNNLSHDTFVLSVKTRNVINIKSTNFCIEEA